MLQFGYDVTGGVVIGPQTVTGTLHRYDTGEEVGGVFEGGTDADVATLAAAWVAEHGTRHDGSKIWPEGLELRLR